MRSRSAIRVFVVEDHAATAKALKSFLEATGYSVHLATDISSALELAPRITFDVLVCDLSLPDGTGWELLEGLRKSAPVLGIAFSAFDEPAHLARSKEAGFVEHVVKGAAATDLVASIERAFRGKGVLTERDNAEASETSGRLECPQALGKTASVESEIEKGPNRQHRKPKAAAGAGFGEKKKDRKESERVARHTQDIGRAVNEKPIERNPNRVGRP
jgi:CheY-like chemotaxis protein